uniref:E3 ubiquitin-protein ligase TRAF7 n=1 Tax=Hydra vulgaris TaxID=6087 RepID=T2MAP7_HYDVU
MNELEQFKFYGPSHEDKNKDEYLINYDSTYVGGSTSAVGGQKHFTNRSHYQRSDDVNTRMTFSSNNDSSPRSTSVNTRLISRQHSNMEKFTSQLHKRSKSDGGMHTTNLFSGSNLNVQASDSEISESVTLFCSSVSEKLLCRLCTKVFKDPVITSCGHTFCQRCVLRNPEVTCPTDGSKLVMVVLNLAVREQVGELYVYCKYACMPSSKGIPGEFEDLKDHLDQCQHASCKFEGTSEELAEHLQSCRFEGMKEFLIHTEKEMNEIRSLLAKKDQENDYMRGIISKLTEKIDQLEKSMEVRIDLLDENFTKLSSDFIETRRCLGHIEKEITSMDSRTFNIGAFDVQSVLKCKGTFVGHHVWDTRSNYTCVKTFTEHSGMVLTLCAYRGKLYSGSADCTISVFDIESLKLIENFSADENPICTLAVGNGMLFSGSFKSIKVWDIGALKFRQALGGLNHWIRALYTTENNLYSGSFEAIKIWDLKTLEQIRVIQTQGGSVYSLVVSREYIICGTYENYINIWDVKTYKSVAKLTGHVGTVYDLVLMTLVDATRVISASYDGSLRVWSLDNLQCVQTLFRHQGSVTSLAVCRGRLFSGSVDSTVKVWL